MKKTTISTKMYLDFIRNTIKIDGIKVADKANKIALELNSITIEQYCAAANIIAKVTLGL